MKKHGPLIIVVLAVLAFIFLLLVLARNRPRKFNPRITLRQMDKIPYGTYVAYQLLPTLFPKAKVSYDKREPGDWDSLDIRANNQAVILIANDFNAEEWELESLKEFIQ